MKITDDAITVRSCTLIKHQKTKTKQQKLKYSHFTLLIEYVKYSQGYMETIVDLILVTTLDDWPKMFLERIQSEAVDKKLILCICF